MKVPKQGALPEPVVVFLEQHTTMTLSTVGKDGTPASTPLFYAIMPNGALVFVSEASTEHVQNLRARPTVALAVYKDGQDWQRIQGLQARGQASPLPREQREEAWAVYAHRFPFLKMAAHGHPQAAALAQALADVGWYAVRLDWVRLIDNRRGFGWKAEWQRTDAGWERVR